MATAFKNLDEISTSYSVFERDQVLTEAQLNSIGAYLDDQVRLSRVSLGGVGIACGLEVSLASNRITVRRGVGVTTDGDLLRLPSDLVFDHVRAYPETAPPYAPFGLGTARVPLWELLPVGAAAVGTVTPLSQFAGGGRPALSEVVAVLLMESQLLDKDQCSGTDCDNLGKTAQHLPRVLLISRANLAPLRERIQTPDAIARALPEVFAARPAITSASSLTSLATAYRKACSTTHDRLVAALPLLHTHGSELLGGLFAGDPTPGWLARLEALRTTWASTTLGIQYYYGFLKDLAETYAAFRDLLFGEHAVCVPDINAFPKHLLLGGVTGLRGDDRTGFYASAANSTAPARVAHARFLASKLNALIHAFALPTGSQHPVRVTPSLFEDAPLEDRAIPWYYANDNAHPIHAHWSHVRRLRGSEASQYSWSAERWGAQGAAAQPLAAQLGRFPFFRIEGHLGAKVDVVLPELQQQIRAHNLPFEVRAILLGSDRRKLPWKRKRRSDLYRLHQMVRYELAQQAQEVGAYAGQLDKTVKDAVKDKRIQDRPDPAYGLPMQSITGFAQQKYTAVSSGAQKVLANLAVSFDAYQQHKSTATQGLQDTLQAAGELKAGLGSAVKIDFASPFDALFVNGHLGWLGWLDGYIQKHEDTEDDRLLFNAFLAEHPGLEHFAGVLRGGTFVLVYDAEKTVVADFMLPYHCPEPPEQVADEPELPKPARPDIVVKVPPAVFKLPELIIRDHLEDFRIQLKPEILNTLGPLVQPMEQYFKGIKDTMELTFRAPAKGVGSVLGKDDYVAVLEADLQHRTQRVDYVRSALMRPGLDKGERERLSKELVSAQEDLAGIIGTVARVVAASPEDLKSGSLEHTVLVQAGQSLVKLEGSALQMAQSGIADASVDHKPQLFAVLDSMSALGGR